jgi:ZIP family zinc transporter
VIAREHILLAELQQMSNLILLGFLASLAAGLATGVGALPVLFVRHPSKRYLDLMLGFAAGAMLFVISDEIISESHRNGHERLATFGVMIGFAVMMLLDVLLG